MNKTGLIEALATKQNLSLNKAQEIINVIFEAFANALKAGERIEIRGFGSFIVNDYKAYIGRNPKTGESIDVKSKRLPSFKAGKDLRERLL